MISWFFLLVSISCISLVYLLLIVSTNKQGSRRRLRRKHLDFIRSKPAIRIGIILIAVLVLAATGIGTWKDVRRPYDNLAKTASLKVLAPTKAAPVLPITSNADNTEEWIEKARLLCTLIIVDIAPIHTESFVLNYPAETDFVLDRTVEGVRVKITGRMQKIAPIKTGNPISLEYLANLRLEWRSWFSRGASGSMEETRSLRSHYCIGSYQPAYSVLSLAYDDSGQRIGLAHSIEVYLLTVPVAEDDPLQEMPWNEFVQNDALPYPEMDLTAWVIGSSSETEMAKILRDTVRFLGGGFFARYPIAFVLLVICMGFLVTLFRRKALAAVVLFTVGMLYIAALDRMALGIHLRHALGSESEDVRRVALANCTQSFFYRNTAYQALASGNFSDSQLLTAAVQSTLWNLAEWRNNQPALNLDLVDRTKPE